jgi:UDP-2,3-diacylglucosamine pyrophosphatase LpxH
LSAAACAPADYGRVAAEGTQSISARVRGGHGVPFMGDRKIFIISDVHVGAGRLDDCDAELDGHLCDFFRELAAREEAVELVINGDFLEFIQAPPWQGRELESKTLDKTPLCFTAEQSRLKLEEICKAHSPIFHGLGYFLGVKSENRLTILPGNHDADFFWEGVRESFLDKVCQPGGGTRGQVDFVLEQVYRPADAPGVWIEHGHQYDPVNAFMVGGEPKWSRENPPILKDRHGEERLLECVGTRLLIKYLNKIDYDYPFVDNVKPLGKFIPLFGRAAFVPDYGLIKAAAAMWGLLKFLATITLHHRGDLLDSPEESGLDPQPVLLEWIRHMSKAEKLAFDEEANARGFVLNRSLETYVSDKLRAEALMTFLSQNLDLISVKGGDASVLGTSQGTLGLYRGFRLDESELLAEKAAEILKHHEVRAVVMGHTHEVVCGPDLAYVNSGCWTRYLDFRKTKHIRSWSVLRENSYELFPFELNYVEVDPKDSQYVRKLTFREKKG